MAEEQHSRQGDILSIGGKKCPECGHLMEKQEDPRRGMFGSSSGPWWVCPSCGYRVRYKGASGWQDV